MVVKKALLAKEITISIKGGELQGSLAIPPDAKGIVLFAHGSGSSRKSVRNQAVAHYLQEENIATLLFDLLTPKEEEVDNITRELRFNIPLLAERLLLASQFVKNSEFAKQLTLGYFGASTGAAAALIAASEMGEEIRAVVSRGGRPDLASFALTKVKSATLLIVGGNDFGVIELNKKAFSLMGCEKKMEIVAGATHLFEESGALEEVSRLAALWFNRYL